MVGQGHVYRVIHIHANAELRYLYPQVPDVVVLFAQRENDAVEFHGVEAGYFVEHNAVLNDFDSREVGLDFLWFVSVRQPPNVNRIPAEIGVLHATVDWSSKSGRSPTST